MLSVEITRGIFLRVILQLGSEVANSDKIDLGYMYRAKLYHIRYLILLISTSLTMTLDRGPVKRGTLTLEEMSFKMDGTTHMQNVYLLTIAGYQLNNTDTKVAGLILSIRSYLYENNLEP